MSGATAPRWLAPTAVAAAVALACATVLMFFADDLAPPRSYLADTYSRSAVGYAALVEWLRRDDRTVLVSTWETASKLGAGDVLLLLEPPAAGDAEASPPWVTLADEALAAGARVVVVLPKWTGTPHRRRTGWIGEVSMLGIDVPSAVLAAAAGGASPRVVRPSAGGRRWASAWGALPGLPHPQLMDLAGSAARPVFSRGDEALIAAFDGGLHVLSDPDLLNTAGLGEADNARIVHRFLFDHLGARNVVIDEVVHGHRQRDTLWASLVEMPLALVTLHLAGVFVLAAWSAAARLGTPLPLPPRLAAGKETLIENTAQLLGRHGHDAHSLDRYAELMMRRVAHACRIEPGLDRDERYRRLLAVSRARGTHHDLETARCLLALERGRSRGAMLEVARALHRWQRQTIHGPSREGARRWKSKTSTA